MILPQAEQPCKNIAFCNLQYIYCRSNLFDHEPKLLPITIQELAWGNLQGIAAGLMIGGGGRVPSFNNDHLLFGDQLITYHYHHNVQGGLACLFLCQYIGFSD